MIKLIKLIIYKEIKGDKLHPLIYLQKERDLEYQSPEVLLH